ncbi:MAG: fibronectin type III domain-containing protein, partial [Bacteroidales bacterium]|nr:fibronectin type III domain-containing protein [Bacteroidales bacterium]
MKKFLLLFMTIFLFGLLSSVRSQETVTIGTGSEDMYTLHNWGWDRVALLYTSDEIDYNGYISKLAFHILGQSTSSSNANRSIKIYLKTIQEDALFASGILSGSWNSVKADAELVYEESDYTCVTGQWKEFDLTNGYDYDGTGNLLVLIEGIGCSPSGSCNIRFSGTSAVSDKYWYGRKDTSAPNDDSNAASVDYGSIPSSAQTTRPNIQITIEETFNCKKPRNIAISNILTNSATLNWQAPSTEPDNGYQIYLSTSSVTPAEDVTPSYSVSTSTLSQDISGLNTGSLYYVWIRSVCENDEYSAWSNPVYFYTKQNAASIPYAQDFETSSENSNWILLNGNQTNKWYIASIAGASSDYGTKGLYISNNNGYANGYDISATSYVYAYRTLNFDEATNYRIKFDWRSYGQSNSDIVRAFLVPESVNLQYGQANGMTGTTNTVPNGWIALSSSLSGQNSWQTFENEFTIDGEENLTGSYNLVFFWKNDNTTGTQPPASIDNISVVKIEECFVPINLSADNINHNSAGISWQLLGAASSTNIIVSTVAITDFEEATLTEQYYSGTTYNTATDLTPQTTYYVYVQAVCAADDLSEWSEALTFTTPQAFAFLPYSHDFAAGSEENANWILANGTQNNKWYIGSTTSGTYTVADGLYISSNSGASNTYSTSYASYTYAYRRMSIDQAGYLSIEFDWRANGESNYDLLRAFLVPESLVSSLTAGSANGMNSDSNTPPTGWIDLTNGKLNLQTGIQHLSSEIEIGTTGIYYLVFFWKNDSSGGTIPPAYVDNIVMSVVTCLKPINLAVSGITTNSANISWTAREDASIWNIIVSDEAITDFTDVTPTAQNLSSAEYSAESLNSATTYYVYVQSVCDVDNLSEWANVTFNTLAAPAELPYECGFDNVTENNSWNFIDHSGKTDKWHIGSTTSGSYAVTNGLYVSGDNGASNTYSSTYTYIYAYRKLNLEDIGTYRIKFDWRCYGESANYDYLRAFLVPDNITITAGSENSIGSSSTPTNWISLSNGPIYQNSNWSTLSTDVEISSSGLYKLVFYWRTDSGTSNPPAAAIDNISVKHISCSSPSNPVATNITNSSANISWTGGEETAWNIKISTEEITDFTGIIPDAQNLSSATYS